MAQRSSRLNGLHPLSYLGVNAVDAPNITRHQRAPTTSDRRNKDILDIWLDLSTTPKNIWMLVSLQNNTATWIEVSTGSTTALSFPTDAGIAVPAANVLSVLGGTGIDTAGVGSVITVSTSGDVATEYTADSGSAIPAANGLNIVGGTDISTSAAGSTITINYTGTSGVLPWTEVTTVTQAMAVNNGYLANNAAPVVLTLPATSALFSIFEVVGKGAGGFKIEQNAGQTIIWDATSSTTTGVGGYIESTDIYDKVRIMCTVADTTFTVVGSKGNIFVA